MQTMHEGKPSSGQKPSCNSETRTHIFLVAAALGYWIGTNICSAKLKNTHDTDKSSDTFYYIQYELLET